MCTRSVYIFVSVCTCMYLCVCLLVCVCIRVSACVYTCVYTCVYLAVCVHVCLCVCVYFLCMCIHMWLPVCTCVCVRACVFTDVLASLVAGFRNLISGLALALRGRSLVPLVCTLVTLGSSMPEEGIAQALHQPRAGGAAWTAPNTVQTSICRAPAAQGSCAWGFGDVSFNHPENPAACQMGKWGNVTEVAESRLPLSGHPSQAWACGPGTRPPSCCGTRARPAGSPFLHSFTHSFS